MKPRINQNRRKRMARIEAKCDAILCQLQLIKKALFNRSSEVDDVIERMHLSAKRMKEQAQKDAQLLRDLFSR